MREENVEATRHALETIAWLDSAQGRELLASLRGYDAAEALVLSGRLRADGIAPHLASAALTQMRLREAARRRMGNIVNELLFTEDGAQQATRTIVARRHAERFARAGVRHVADLGCGLGADSLAFLNAGLSVTAVELDPVTAAIAEANLRRTTKPQHTVKVIRGDALEAARTLEPDVALWADPARRRGGRRIQDPEQWSPPLSSVLTLSGVESVPPNSPAPAADSPPSSTPDAPSVEGPKAMRRALGVKVAPGIDHAALPAAAEVEFVSVDGALVEACVWLGAVCEEPGRVAVVVRTGSDGAGDSKTNAEEDPVSATDAGASAWGGGVSCTAVLREDAARYPEAHAADCPVRMAPVRPLGEYLYEPDDAVLRAGLVARAGELLGPHAAAGIVSPGIGYLTGDAWPDSSDAAPFLTAYRILEVLPLATKKLKARLRALGATSVAIKKRGVNIDPEILRRDLGFGARSAKRRGSAQTPHEATLIVTPVEGKVRVLLVEPLR